MQSSSVHHLRPLRHVPHHRQPLPPPAAGGDPPPPAPPTDRLPSVHIPLGEMVLFSLAHGSNRRALELTLNREGSRFSFCVNYMRRVAHRHIGGSKIKQFYSLPHPLLTIPLLVISDNESI
jgi:hypothetical protein